MRRRHAPGNPLSRQVAPRDRFLDAVIDQQQAFVTSFNEVREHHAATKNQLSEVREAVERERRELSRLREETRLAEEEARLARQALEDAREPMVPEAELHRQLEAQRMELQGKLDSMDGHP